MHAIAYRTDSPSKRVMYVEFVKGDGGADWGYTQNAANALPLSPYWQRRFAADCRYCGTVAHFSEVA